MRYSNLSKLFIVEGMIVAVIAGGVTLVCMLAITLRYHATSWALARAL